MPLSARSICSGLLGPRRATRKQLGGEEVITDGPYIENQGARGRLLDTTSAIVAGAALSDY
jgi:hypothetical protein